MSRVTRASDGDNVDVHPLPAVGVRLDHESLQALGVPDGVELDEESLRTLGVRSEAGMNGMTDDAAIKIGRRLVWSLANRWGRTDDEREDLSQEGFTALVLAARAFEPERGFAFITYAHPRVHGAVLRAAHVLRRRGLTPIHECKGRRRDPNRYLETKGIDSLDATIAEDTTLHDLVAVDGDTEALASMREIVAALPVDARAALEHGEVNDDHRRAFGLPVDKRVGRGRVYTYRGRAETITTWSRETGISFIVLYTRLVVKGWTVERTMETPVARAQGGRGRKRAA